MKSFIRKSYEAYLMHTGGYLGYDQYAKWIDGADILTGVGGSIARGAREFHAGFHAGLNYDEASETFLK